MGMDTSCGICGKHYQTCKHRMKDHAINDETGRTFCGKDPVKVVAHDIDVVEGSWYMESVDPDDLCKICKKLTMYEKTMIDLYESFLVAQ